MRSAWLVLVVAAAVRLAAVLWLSDTVPYSDYFYYHEAGRMQAEDPRFYFSAENAAKYAKLAWWPPGYPIFLAGLYAVTGPSPRAAAFVHVALGLVTCALVLALSWRACGRPAGIAAGWIVALDPTYVFTTNLLASENLFAPLLAGGLWLAARARAADRLRGWVAAGAVLGAAALVRAAGLCVPFVVGAWAWRRAARGERRGALAAAVLAGTFLVLAPWTLRNLAVTGRPVLVCAGGGLNFWFGHNEDGIGYRELAGTPLAGLGDAAAIDARGTALAFETLRRNPLGFVTRGVRKVGTLFAPPADALHANTAVDIEAARGTEAQSESASTHLRRERRERLLHGPFTWLAAVHLYALVLAALVVLVWRRGRLPAEIQLAAWVAAAWIAVHVVFWAQPRFRYPLDVPLALIASAGLGARAHGRSRT